MKNLDLIVTTNGRQEYISRTIDSWRELINDNVNKKVIIDDSGDPSYRRWLAETFEDFEVFPLGEERTGYKTLLKTWSCDLDFDSEYVLVLEDDFLLLENINVEYILNVLDQNPDMLQMTLKRQAWSQGEIAAGGLVEALYDGQNFIQSDGWFKHRMFFTTNPSFIKIDRFRDIARPIYEENPQLLAEGELGDRIFEKYDSMYLAFLGEIFEAHKVEHIGWARTGINYV